jgi:CPA2 family monovalent cation:H+ antiporter-2
MGTAAVAYLSGLPMALGAFLAGMLLAETEFRHQVESDLKPFKGVLIGLFFMAVGMTLEPAALGAQLPVVVAAGLGLAAIKTGILTVLARSFALPPAVGVHIAVLLGQGGEFAFVAVVAARTAGLLEPALVQFMLAVTAFSMLLTPAQAALGAWLARRLERRQAENEFAQPDGSAAPAALIVGFGRMGVAIAGELAANGLTYAAVDRDPARVRRWRLAGQPVFYGDAARSDVLLRLGIRTARVAVVCIDRPDAARQVVAAMRRLNPTLAIAVRARDERHVGELRALGAAATVTELRGPSEELTELTLRLMRESRP